MSTHAARGGRGNCSRIRDGNLYTAVQETVYVEEGEEGRGEGGGAGLVVGRRGV